MSPNDAIDIGRDAIVVSLKLGGPIIPGFNIRRVPPQNSTEPRHLLLTVQFARGPWGE